jgi:hypothetical protein
VLRISGVEPLSGHWLRLTLTDGTIVDREVGDLLHGPVFAAVRSDPSSFGSVAAMNGTINWPGGVDLDPEVLIWGGSPDSSPTSWPPPVLQLRRPASVD